MGQQLARTRETPLQGGNGAAADTTTPQDPLADDPPPRLLHECAAGVRPIKLIAAYLPPPSSAGARAHRLVVSRESSEWLDLLDADTGDRVRTIIGGGGGEVRSLLAYHLSPDGEPRVASGHAGGRVDVWCGDMGEAPLRLRAHDHEVGCLATYNMPGTGETRLVSGDAGGVIVVWDGRSGDRLHALAGLERDAICALVGYRSADNERPRLAAGSSGGAVWVFDPEAGEVVFRLPGHTAGVVALSVFEPSAAYSNVCIVSGTVAFPAATVWDGETGEGVARLERRPGVSGAQP
jgi:WD40 repeat protein